MKAIDAKTSQRGLKLFSVLFVSIIALENKYSKAYCVLITFL